VNRGDAIRRQDRIGWGDVAAFRAVVVWMLELGPVPGEIPLAGTVPEMDLLSGRKADLGMRLKLGEKPGGSRLLCT
jgi:hypothetical protein